MKDRDNISDIYRKQVDELLEDQVNLNPDDPLKQEELDEIWNEVSVELDISEVWNGISSGLDRVMPVDQGSGFIFKSIVLVLILFIGTVLVRVAFLDSGAPESGVQMKDQRNERPTGVIIKSIQGDPLPGNRVRQDIPPAESNHSGPFRGEITPASREDPTTDISAPGQTYSNPAAHEDDLTIEESCIVPALIPVDPLRTRELSIGYPDGLIMNEITSGSGSELFSNNKRKLSIGIITMFKNTWLLNQETLDGLKSETLNTTVYEYFFDIGLSLNYRVKNTWSLQADGFFYSNTGQEYYEYIYGHYSNKQIILEYMTVALSVKHKFTGNERFLYRSSINLLAGGYMSFLRTANQKINSDLNNIESQYSKIDFGVRLGSEIELPLSGHLSIAPGLFLSLGIPNISKSIGKIPGTLLNTRNGSAGFNLAFYIH